MKGGKAKKKRAVAKRKFETMRDDLRIRGIEYRPQGENLPIAIVCHGILANYQTTKHYAKMFAKWGYAAYCFDFAGGGIGCKSDGKMTEMSVLTEKKDLQAVIGYAKSLSYTNADNLVLMGCSQGGFVSAMVAAQFGKAVSKLIMLYPALCIPDDARKGKMLFFEFDPENIPDIISSGPVKIGGIYVKDAINMDPYEEISGFGAPVLIVHGAKDKIVKPSYSKKAKAAYGGRCTLCILPKAGHGFKKREDKRAFYEIKQFLDRKECGTMKTMKGAILPGDSTVELREFEVPVPKHGEVLIRTKATTICGSDIRCIYREHLGKGPEGYIPGMICGHEPCGVIEETGEGMRRFKKGDRVIVYHISGCGVCYDCRRGYMISCSSPMRRAYGWQRNGGMAPFILAEEKDLVLLPDELSYLDGAQVACGFGTVYEALEKIGICGNDAVLVVGLGPIGLATLQVAKAMGADKLIGVEASPERMELAKELELADYVLHADDKALSRILEITGGFGVEKAVDTSASDAGRQLSIRATRQWGKIAFVGEGGACNFNPSPDIIHGQKTIYGSWVTSIWKMEELVERLVRWGIHPDKLVTHKFPLEEADKAFALMAECKCGKVAVTFE